jgi:CDP-4-dehydro-6-deoxyglucose reductase, E3
MLITRVPAGQTSTWVHDRLTVGERVSLSGPYGTFVSDPIWSGPLLFLAAGSGLAPIRSLVEAELATASKRRVTVVFSARTEADVIDRERFGDLVDAHSRLRFIRTLTRGPGPAPRGRIPGLLSELCGDLAGHHVFIAGSSGFVLGSAAAANAAGAIDVQTEVFFLEPSAGGARPSGQPVG